MKKIVLIVLIATFVAINTYSQSGQDASPMAVETMCFIPKRGMEDKFEADVVTHNKKFHTDGKYVASLRKIEYGSKAEWYVWVMGPTSYETLDNPLGKTNGHEDDWNTTVDPLVEEYGATLFWNFNAKLSYGLDIVRKSKHFEVWSVDLKPGQYYRFKAITEKLKKVYEAQGNTAFIVLDNNLHTAGGPDVMLVWSFDTYAGWMKDPGPKAEYEKQNGEGSWQRLLDEWMDIIVDYNSDIRSNIN